MVSFGEETKETSRLDLNLLHRAISNNIDLGNLADLLAIRTKNIEALDVLGDGAGAAAGGAAFDVASVLGGLAGVD